MEQTVNDVANKFGLLCGAELSSLFYGVVQADKEFTVQCSAGLKAAPGDRTVIVICIRNASSVYRTFAGSGQAGRRSYFVCVVERDYVGGAFMLEKGFVHVRHFRCRDEVDP